MRGVWWFGIVVAIMAVLALAMRFLRTPILYRRVVQEDDSFGVSGKGFHSLHIGDVAVGDFLVTVALGAAFSLLSNGPFVFWFVLSLVVGEVMHFVFGVKSATIVWLFGGAGELLNNTSTVELNVARNWYWTR